MMSVTGASILVVYVVTGILLAEGMESGLYRVSVCPVDHDFRKGNSSHTSAEKASSFPG